MEDLLRMPPQAPSARGADALLAALAYVGVLFLVPLLLVGRKSDFLKFHLRQGIVLFALSALLGLLNGPWLYAVLLPAGLSVFCIVQAASGKKWQLPLVGRHVQRIEV